jgi:hypothetical protein
MYQLVYVSDSGGNFTDNIGVNVTIFSEDKEVMNTTMVTIGDEGFANLSFKLSGFEAGKYLIVANGTPVDVFRVETFKLHGKVTDLSGNPAFQFSPGSKAKIWAVARDIGGNLLNLDSPPTITVMLPDGSSFSGPSQAEQNSTGVYSAESGLLDMPGEYKIVLTGTYNSENEKFETGFKVQSVEMMLMLVNTKYMDEGTGPGTMVSAFAPGTNITAVVLILDSSKGSSLKSGGPPCGSDGSSCISTGCNGSQFSVAVRDEKGNRFKLSLTSMLVQGYRSTCTMKMSQFRCLYHKP